MLTYDEFLKIKESEKLNELIKIDNNRYRFGKFYITSWNDPIYHEEDGFSVDYLTYQKGYTRTLIDDSGNRKIDYVPDTISFFGMKLSDEILNEHLDEIVEWGKNMDAEISFD